MIAAAMPCTSAAGFERVNVTQRKFDTLRAVNSLSSHRTSSGNALMPSAAEYDWQKRATAGSSSALARAERLNGGACTTTTPGMTTRASANPSGKRNPGGKAVGSVRRGGPAAAITSFDPAFNPVPE